MPTWKTIRSFNIQQEIQFKDKLIPDNAVYSLRESDKGLRYWQAFFRQDGKVKSVHIGKELPFDEPKPVPSVNELLLTVSKLEKENERLKDKIKELEERQQINADLLSASTLRDSGIYTQDDDTQPLEESIHIKTFLGMDNKLRAESAILIMEYKGKAMRVQLYPDKEFSIQYRPGKKLWKSIEQVEARKIVSKWQKNEIIFTFSKNKNPNRIVEDYIEAVVISKDCENILF